MRTLKSTAGEKASYSEAAFDGMREDLEAAQAHLGEMMGERDAALQSLLEVAKMRTSPSRPLPSQRDAKGKEDIEQNAEDNREGSNAIGTSGGGAHGFDRNGDTRRSLYPDVVVVHRNSEDSRIGDFMQVPDDESSEGPIKMADIDGSSSRVGSPWGTPPTTPGGTGVDHAAGLRRTDDGGACGDVGWHSSSGTGEHICRVCGAPAPSFRKLFDCRLSLDRARADAAEASAREAIHEERAASEIRQVNDVDTLWYLTCAARLHAWML